VQHPQVETRYLTKSNHKRVIQLDYKMRSPSIRQSSSSFSQAELNSLGSSTVARVRPCWSADPNLAASTGTWVLSDDGVKVYRYCAVDKRTFRHASMLRAELPMVWIHCWFRLAMPLGMTELSRIDGDDGIV
jgi:hypothetical protein